MGPIKIAYVFVNIFLAILSGLNFKFEKDVNEMIGVNNSNRGVQEGAAVGATADSLLNSTPGRSYSDSDGMNREERRRRARK
jgi:hypothetical protein